MGACPEMLAWLVVAVRIAAAAVLAAGAGGKLLTPRESAHALGALLGGARGHSGRRAVAAWATAVLVEVALIAGLLLGAPGAQAAAAAFFAAAAALLTIALAHGRGG